MARNCYYRPTGVKMTGMNVRVVKIQITVNDPRLGDMGGGANRGAVGD